MRSCLVVYYSRTGITEQVARKIAEMCNCDIEAIRDGRSRKGPLGFLRSAIESITRKQPVILAPTKDPADYQLVILGTPVWVGRISSPMRTYIERYRSRFSRIAVFCTMAGSGGDKVIAELSTLCDKAPLRQVALSNSDVQQGQYEQRLEPFKDVSRALS